MVFITPHSFVFFLVYLLLIFIIFCVDRFFLFWSLIEIRTLVFMGISYSFFKNNFSHLLTFFIVQTISAFSILIFYVLGLESAFTLALFLKLSMFPFHFWYLGLISFFPNLIIFISSTFYKIPSMLILYNYFYIFNYNMLRLSVLSTILVGALSMVYTNDLRFLLVRSSVSNNSWFVLSTMSRFSFFLSYLFFYSLFLFFILNSIGSLSSGSLSKTNFKSVLLTLFCLVSMAGIPPFPIFFIKILIIINLIYGFFSLNMYLFFVILFSVIMLLGYLKYCFRVLINLYGTQSFITI